MLNLIPFAIDTPAGTLYSDGLGFVVSFLRPREYYGQMLAMEDEEDSP